PRSSPSMRPVPMGTERSWTQRRQWPSPSSTAGPTHESWPRPEPVSKAEMSAAPSN
ncbi:uncharacterized protein METZ01_LOCUS139256, partial [marine metagenome]